jgi:glucokinase
MSHYGESAEGSVRRGKLTQTRLLANPKENTENSGVERTSPMFIGVEIGGTKLQIGVGSGDGVLVGDVVRLKVDPAKGAQGIRDQLICDGLIHAMIQTGLKQSDIEGIGIGFGGPVDSKTGRTIMSHQIDGWEDYPIVEWLQFTFNTKVALGNDSDLAGWAEAKLGAGLGAETVVYSNIGSGIGGAFIRNGELYTGQGIGAAEIGHLRMIASGPGESWRTLEDLASGWALDRVAQSLLNDKNATAMDLSAAAKAGDQQARLAWADAVEWWGVAFANVATLLCPDRFVVGGGVALQGDFLLTPLREVFRRNIFPPFADRCFLALAELGETMVVQGALLLVGSGSANR